MPGPGGQSLVSGGEKPTRRTNQYQEFASVTAFGGLRWMARSRWSQDSGNAVSGAFFNTGNSALMLRWALFRWAPQTPLIERCIPAYWIAL